MSEHYIGRAAEAAARAKHNRIHKMTKKTSKKKPTKAAQAFTEALGIQNPGPITHIGKNRIVTEPEHYDGQDADDWQEFGPPPGVDENAIARSILGFDTEPVPDAHQPPPEALREHSGDIALDAPTKPPEPVAPPKEVLVYSRVDTVRCIEDLLDAVNHLFKLASNRNRVLEKDIPILKRRVAMGRELVESLKAP